MRSSHWNYLECENQTPRPNQALSNLVLFRIRKKFQRLFPSIEIIETGIFSNFARYMLSGEIYFRQLVPNSMIPAIRISETLTRPSS